MFDLPHSGYSVSICSGLAVVIPTQTKKIIHLVQNMALFVYLFLKINTIGSVSELKLDESTMKRVLSIQHCYILFQFILENQAVKTILLPKNIRQTYCTSTVLSLQFDTFKTSRLTNITLNEQNETEHQVKFD